jgi:hypothetical protein
MINQNKPSSSAASGIIEEANLLLASLIDIVSADFLPLNKLLRNYHRKAESRNECCTNASASSRECYENLEQVVKNLQFHDILHQKISHVAHINNLLIEDLNQDRRFYSSMMAEILQLNQLQLELMENEYCNALKEIKTSLQKVEKHISNFSLVSLNLSDFIESSEAFGRIIQLVRDLFSQAIIESLNAGQGHVEQVLSAIASSYTMESEHRVFKEFFSEYSFSFYQNSQQEADIELF